ncbi:uncharacterized protein J4E78_000653 [Alternaria triticimaculans]|uniref:uncharacterized protein n=1 Tax=Alternaria triticimaculans TaxID=297637 RepID=UPI0020C3B2D4|nr:uncharacterized protein J4E78_000653 [Alternaria triticimaculans]KAI4672153.1 hypothetical protein J4E78_000653 [Alternaria triticimaculans]
MQTSVAYLIFCTSAETIILEKDFHSARILRSSTFISTTNHDVSLESTANPHANQNQAVHTQGRNHSFLNAGGLDISVTRGYGVKLKWQDDAANTLAKPPRKSRKKKAIDDDQALSPASAISFESIQSVVTSPDVLFSSPDSAKMTMDTEPALATVMMMQVSARLFGDEDEANVANHLTGAKAMITGRSGSSWLVTSSARFLLSLFAYHDILSSVSRGSQPLLDHEMDFVAIEGEKELESIAKVLVVVAKISQLQHAIKTRRALSPTSLALSEDENTTGQHIQQILLAMEFGACKRRNSEECIDISSTAEAYRHAAFIYLYRTWLDIGAPNPISMEHINQCLSQLQQVDIHSPLTSAHMWPLFTAGCEAIDSTQRQFVRDRFEKLYAVKHFPSLKRVMRDIEHVWAAKDMEQQMKGQDGMAKVDCIQVILKRRGREVDLA